MSININGTEIRKIIYDGTTLEKVICNGKTIYNTTNTVTFTVVENDTIEGTTKSNTYSLPSGTTYGQFESTYGSTTDFPLCFNYMGVIIFGNMDPAWSGDIVFNPNLEIDDGTTVTYRISVARGDVETTVIDSTIAEIGTINVKANGDGIKYYFIAPETGIYTFTSTSNNAYLGWINDNVTEWLDSSILKIELEASKSIIIVCATNDWNDDTYDLTIEKIT